MSTTTATPARCNPSKSDVTAALNDGERLRDIIELGLLSPDVDDVLHDLAAEAARHFGLPIGLVSVVLNEAQFFAAMHGLTGWAGGQRGTPIEWSFCQFAVASREPLVVENAITDPLVKDNPLVRENGVRCYAGVPLISSRGHALGSFCVIGLEERAFSDRELADLHQFAAAAVARIETRRRRPAAA
jgi:GAF domain-containing protein